MGKQRGFTLIELIVVIIILGILAAYAAPRYFNMEKEARAAVVKGVYGSIKTATELVYAVAVVKVQTAIANGDGASTVTDVTAADGTVVTIVNSGATGSHKYYPTPDNSGIRNAISDIESDFDVTVDTDVISFYPHGVSSTTTCQITYNYPTNGETAPNVTYNASDCS